MTTVLTLVATAAEESAKDSADPTSWLEVTSLGVAILSFLLALAVGLWNRSTAKRALTLAEQQEARREARIDLSLDESVSWRNAYPGGRLLGFHLLITNPTDRPSSLVGAELRLTYGSDLVITTVKVRHDQEVRDAALPETVRPLELPARLDSNGAVAGWFLFRVDGGLTGGHPIDRYDVAVRDVHGIEELMQVTVFREASGDEAE